MQPGRVPKLQSSPFQKHHFIFSLACGSFFVSPAYAGKSYPPTFIVNIWWDHPRVCGEKLLTPSRNQSHLGSPPRMRGKDARNKSAHNSAGITPAYAGKSGIWRTICAWQKDHPRVCGEKAPAAGHCSTDTGSPPRMRGKEPVAKSSITKLRITPAYAGKSRENTADTSR